MSWKVLTGQITINVALNPKPKLLKIKKENVDREATCLFESLKNSQTKQCKVVLDRILFIQVS